MEHKYTSGCDAPEEEVDVILVWYDEEKNDTALIGYYSDGKWYGYTASDDYAGSEVPEPAYWMSYDKELPNGAIIS